MTNEDQEAAEYYKKCKRNGVVKHAALLVMLNSQIVQSKNNQIITLHCLLPTQIL